MAAVAAGSFPSLKALGYKSPNEKLNLAAIGAGGQPFGDLRAAHGGRENVVALCDINDQRIKEAGKIFPKARTYWDWRRMFDQKDIEAVVICTAAGMKYNFMVNYKCVDAKFNAIPP